MNRWISIITIFISCATCLLAQDRDPLKEYEEFRKKATKEYNDFRDNANADYAKFMREAWKEFGAEPPIPVPPSPDPPKPPVVEPEEKPTVDSIPFEVVIPPAPPVVQPRPIAPIPVAPIPVIPKPQATPPGVPLFSFRFYDTECRIRLENSQKIRLSDLSEETIAGNWEKLSSAEYNPAIADCLDLREQLKLCDWGYYQLVKTIADKFYGTAYPNESVLFQSFILTQSGYKVRMARAGEKLVTLIPFDQTVYTYMYLALDGQKFFVMDEVQQNAPFYVCNYQFPKEQIFSLQINRQPEFSEDKTPLKTFSSARYSVNTEVETNQNLIDFYGSYPKMSEWNLYAKASLSEQIKEQLYPVLKNAIAGKSQTEAANLLINFVQTAFEYQTDGEQFGYERPFFADETFYYPSSDCEDRAILFSILIHDLLDLDAVLLNYPNHLATAVRFDEDVEGDYLMIENQKYTVCDPTYIGANIGRAMPAVKNTRPKVVRI